MDIGLPGMDGIECMKTLKPDMPRVQFMMCTVYDDDDHIFNALKSGASGYILKRTSPAQILEAIRAVEPGVVVIPIEAAGIALGAVAVAEIPVNGQHSFYGDHASHLKGFR